jgi:hypothetical protein
MMLLTSADGVILDCVSPHCASAPPTSNGSWSENKHQHSPEKS